MNDQGRVFSDPEELLAFMRRARGRGIRPEPMLTVSEWADKNRVLTSRTSALPGRWRSIRFPFCIAIMDALSVSSHWRRVVTIAARQVGKTEIGLNWLGYIIHHAPGPTLMVQPSLDMVKKVSRQRIAALVESTPAIKERMRSLGTKRSGQSMFMVEFDGGIIIMAGANSSASLRSMPVRNLFADEVNEYDEDVDGQGDPLAIAEASTASFPNSKVYIAGNPGIRGHSRIEREWQNSNQSRFYVECPVCGFPDFITWNGFRDFVGRIDPGHHRIGFRDNEPSTAHMICGRNGCEVDERHKKEMLEGGEWIATAPGDGRTFGTHLPSMYSPLGFLKWSDMVAEFLKAKDKKDLLHSFVNNYLGETWEESWDSVDVNEVSGRAEEYIADVPSGVGMLVASVDVHPDRLEVLVKGYGAGEESWLIAWHQIDGDPKIGQMAYVGRRTNAPALQQLDAQSVWYRLDEYLQTEWMHASGRKLRIECTTVDSGGHHTEHVYRFCSVRAARRIYAIKGGSERNLPLVALHPTRSNKYRTPLYVLCVDSGKQTVMSRLRIAQAGAGAMHFPKGLDSEYYLQLAASERPSYKWHRGQGTVREWVKLRERNEALDLEVYALAALYIMGQPNLRALGDRAAKYDQPLPAGAPETPPPATNPRRTPGFPTPPSRRRNWVTRW